MGRVLRMALLRLAILRLAIAAKPNEQMGPATPLPFFEFSILLLIKRFFALGWIKAIVIAILVLVIVVMVTAVLAAIGLAFAVATLRRFFGS